MGIGRLYYLIALFMCCAMHGKSHFKDFDGNFHRPRNQYKKEAQKQAQQDAANRKADKLADEVGSNRQQKYGASRRRDGTPAPRPVSIAAGSRSGRQGSRARDARASRGRRDARSASYASDEWPSFRRGAQSDMEGTPVKPNPFSEYVPEAHVLDKNPPPAAPFRPVHSTRKHSSFRRPSDFATPDPYRPGHSIRDGDYEAYKHLFGGYDDQYHSPYW